jgi:hypothetical protein
MKHSFSCQAVVKSFIGIYDQLLGLESVIENMMVAQLVKKFLAYYGTRGFITELTTARHWALS